MSFDDLMETVPDLYLHFAFWIATTKTPELFCSCARSSHFYVAGYSVKLDEFATNRYCQPEDTGAKQRQRARLGYRRLIGDRATPQGGCICITAVRELVHARSQGV